jgi:hypothetical protein
MNRALFIERYFIADNINLDIFKTVIPKIEHIINLLFQLFTLKELINYYLEQAILKNISINF